jgi:hypothetical protein
MTISSKVGHIVRIFPVKSARSTQPTTTQQLDITGELALKRGIMLYHQNQSRRASLH